MIFGKFSFPFRVFFPVLLLCVIFPLPSAGRMLMPDGLPPPDSGIPETVADTASVTSVSSGTDASWSRFRPVQLVAPGSLILIGSLGAGSGWFHRAVNLPLRNDFQQWRGDRRFRVDDYLQYLPVAAHVGLSLCGVPSRTDYKERFAVLVTSSLVMATVVNLTKYTVRKERPDGSSRNSFMSGHTATAFMGAELVRTEYAHASRWYGVGAYTVATGIAFLRMYNNRHWLGDVVCGAGVGILSARIGYWMLPLERKWFGWDKKSKGRTLVALPYYQHESKAFGGTFARVF